MALSVPGRQAVLGGLALLLGIGDVAVLDAHLLPRYQQERGSSSRAPAAPASAPHRPLGADPARSGSSVPPPPRPAAKPEPAAPASAGTPAALPATRPPSPSPLQPICRIFFAAAASRPSADSGKALDACVARWRQRPSPLTLVGHTDRRGWPQLNRRLGWQRASSIAALLRALGVPRGQILNLRSEASDRPFDPGDNETAWGRNRRVEIWSGTGPPTPPRQAR